MKYSLTLLLSFLLFEFSQTYAQPAGGITFIVEKLKAPDSLIEESDSRRLLHDIAPDLLVHSPTPENLVDMGAHPFFNGMYKAYAEHRPFEISPDMIWLLICQGFSHHVNNNAEELRSMFVNFEGKKSLIVKSDFRAPIDSLATWEEIIPQFIDQASENTGKELFDNLTPAFSTTTSVEKIATQITALESVKSYFEFIVLRVVCGIPSITLKGTSADWKLVLSKAKALRKYKLGWWIDEIEPQLEQFIKASEGKINKTFWRNMFKYHTEKKYGLPRVIDGWIVKFFPYNNKRQRNNLKRVRSSDDLPDERVAVDFKLVTMSSDGSTDTKSMQFVAGFIGLKQDHKTMSLCPQISWLVIPKDTVKVFTSQLEEESKSDFGLWIRVSELPAELLHVRTIKRIQVEFIDSIKIPPAFSLTDINDLHLEGKISKEEELKITSLFPDTKLSINNHQYNHDRDTAFFGLNNLAELPERLKHKDIWRIVYIFSLDSLIIPEQIPAMNIARLEISIGEELSKGNEKKLMSLFPHSEIYVDEQCIASKDYLQKLALRKQRLLDWQKLNTGK